MTVGGLNASFSADSSPFALLNREMLKKFKVGSVMAFFAWYDLGIDTLLCLFHADQFQVSYIASFLHSRHSVRCSKQRNNGVGAGRSIPGNYE